ncbi:hypothetical protein [Halorubrum sp. GN12_10-3_MGM]|uniref:hypothetical protein n=1 Tax=Halorubrum sp. GN12_10-3_MGM TaxID=2518113 RepID=UPI0010F782D5|nr:hypothetical protein [Halorubrum sp. GN12_10-3_MGM]TKX64362.1 hypothetical protein EXE47_11660 [Halorubrum sp. GN12_10-3_MGM]
MAQLSAYSEDLYELVAALDDRGVLRSGEREAWEEGIDDADEISELRTTEEALHKAMLNREGVTEVVSKHTAERTQAFV